ncbi:2-succinyl-5-enolpyruvyl-6-hydroxy-3-cyclohexene-1-carboxylic-acid synthase [Demequina sp. SYSU T00192]|uniref:2-succinyl-5-enolpyruvyl-6-hydroxy-3-cyclohexene-1-carboxylate synthase n=1 Tax=Demequina litoralis TaxID=3051660 RepID=A0ABT8G898_9MICO|nr:2-succinyl-5-enolpyruvyl-6-hydroxy-3-cyclohexene-1-carboxylic-acid synthase [Demequina sp. SYSU T00192]MDN4475358.1 2-succinyl-5-enolpyruvyl-6-hydroxy-3-cyclohexene-1-carboxylic-acid synthase [Demequina sp. SYSU T00192]
MTEHPSGAFARALVAALAERGVEDYVLSPGSRSGPLAHALAEAGAENPPLGAPRIRLHVRIDERSAAFLALGIARGRAAAGDPRPVAIVTTSGTAVGNLMPAVMEAHHSGVPLLLLTADRPTELRGVGANQTTDQVGLFGAFVRWGADVPAAALGDRPDRATALADRAVRAALGDRAREDLAAAGGPVHVNVAFREPLGADGGLWSDPPRLPTPTGGIPIVAPPEEPAPLPPVARGVVIAGDGAGDVARQVAEAHGWPLLAEPTSLARSGSHCVPDYVRLLESAHGRDLADRVHQVVVIGRPTLTRPVQALIARAPALVVARFGARWREAPPHAQAVLRDVPASWLWSASPDDADPGWLAEWRAAGGRVQVPEGWGPRVVAAAFAESLRDGVWGVVGSSGPVRSLDRLMPSAPAGAAPMLLANRGLAGIDGTVSTAAGIAFGSGHPVHALMGDVTFLHEAGGLLVGPREERPRLRIVVVNDGGGTIFGGLEHGGAPAENLERVFTTPHGADLASVCAGYRVPHRAVRSRDELVAALGEPVTALEVVEALVR